MRDLEAGENPLREHNLLWRHESGVECFEGRIGAGSARALTRILSIN